MIKLLAFFAAYRLLRRVVMIAIAAALAVLLLTGTRDPAGHANHTVRQLEHVARPFEQLLQHALQKADGP